ncbi:MAG: topoisomerase IV [Oscillospiraceae bacterium]|jgi:DNA gyrase subunit A|nr:topoisomerase IV [Oscillospiraceae bacterium]
MPKKTAAVATTAITEVREHLITDMLETNFMPYAMSVIVSRALPEIDGFKPSQRKLLYTMYKMGLLTGNRTKSANIVGQTMRLNPHGEGAIYETMVRMSKGYEALLTPFVDSKGSFGKVYSRDMAYAASRYTEAKLAEICTQIFSDIDKDAVDFRDNYDGTMKEPELLPTAFPNVLVSSNMGIAVGMASRVCGFNLKEVCDSAIAYMRNPQCDLLETMPAPDFSTGGELLYDRTRMDEIYRSGEGSFKVRAKWRYIKAANIVEVYEIPYSTTAEQIIDKVSDLVKSGKVKDVADMRDETDLNGLKLAIDLKRGADPDRVMRLLMKLTPLCDSFSCNFNILIAGTPRVLGVREVLEEWCEWRVETVRRRVYFDLNKKRERLHLFRGLGKILLDIDKAIRIIRETESESDVVPNLMIGFAIDELQADYVAEIRLRNINREYILKQIQQTDELERDIAELELIVGDRERIKRIITDELRAIAKKYGTPRRTELVSALEPEPDDDDGDNLDDYPVTLFLSQHGYFKKITAQSLRMSGEQKYKEDDAPRLELEASNRSELIIFTDKCQAYKARAGDFADGKASQLGDYLPAKLGMDEGENVVYLAIAGDWSGSMLFAYANGKVARVPLSAYATKSNRRKLTGAYSDKSPLVAALSFEGEREAAVFTSESKALVFSTAQIAPKLARDTQGVQVITVRGKALLTRIEWFETSGIENASGYKYGALPASGKRFTGQLTL